MSIFVKIERAKPDPDGWLFGCVGCGEWIDDCAQAIIIGDSARCHDGCVEYFIWGVRNALKELKSKENDYFMRHKTLDEFLEEEVANGGLTRYFVDQLRSIPAGGSLCLDCSSHITKEDIAQGRATEDECNACRSDYLTRPTLVGTYSDEINGRK